MPRLAPGRLERWLERAQLTADQTERFARALEDARANYRASARAGDDALFEAMLAQRDRMTPEQRDRLDHAARAEDVKAIDAIHRELDATAPDDERERFHLAWAAWNGEAVEDDFYDALDAFLSHDQVSALRAQFPIFSTLVRR